jgi:hypothetical protein
LNGGRHNRTAWSQAKYSDDPRNGEAQKHSIVGRETNNLTDEAWGELQKSYNWFVGHLVRSNQVLLERLGLTFLWTRMRSSSQDIHVISLGF